MSACGTRIAVLSLHYACVISVVVCDELVGILDIGVDDPVGNEDRHYLCVWLLLWSLFTAMGLLSVLEWTPVI